MHFPPHFQLPPCYLAPPGIFLRIGDRIPNEARVLVRERELSWARSLFEQGHTSAAASPTARVLLATEPRPRLFPGPFLLVGMVFAFRDPSSRRCIERAARSSCAACRPLARTLVLCARCLEGHDDASKVQECQRTLRRRTYRPGRTWRGPALSSERREGSHFPGAVSWGCAPRLLVARLVD